MRRGRGGADGQVAGAERRENWFMACKELWRSSSREGDLHHIAEIVFWYADLLREKNQIVLISFNISSDVIILTGNERS